MIRRTCLILLLTAQLPLCTGCCGLFVHPTVEEARQWAAKETPPGSPETAVVAFARRHEFSVDEGQPEKSCERNLSLTRIIDNCMRLYVGFIEVKVCLDKAGRVKTVSVQRGEFWR